MDDILSTWNTINEKLANACSDGEIDEEETERILDECQLCDTADEMAAQFLFMFGDRGSDYDENDIEGVHYNEDEFGNRFDIIPE
jgi:hypothetical protein